MPFRWYRDIPVWVAAVGTGALAVIAFTTLGPVIENLELRDRNLDLAEKKRQLQVRIKASETREDELNVELGILNRKRDAASDEIEDLKRKRDAASDEIEDLHKRQDKLLETLTQISGSISEQTAREQELRTRLDQLEDEARQLRSTRNKLEARNKQLELERVEAQDRLRHAEKELERIDEELKSTYRMNRRFILEQISTKVTDSVPIRGEGRYDDYIFDFGFPFGLEVGLIKSLKFKPLKAWTVPVRRPQLGETVAPRNGRQLVLAEFGSQIFKLLPEVQKPSFQDAIRDFMNKNSEIFSANLLPNTKLYERFWTKRRLVQRTEGSKYFDNSVSKPDKESKHEIKARELAYEKAKFAFETDVTRFHAARIALHDVMERMVVKLTDF